MNLLSSDGSRAAKGFERAILRCVSRPKEGLCDAAKYALLYHISEFSVWRYLPQGSGLLTKSVLMAALASDASGAASKDVTHFHCDIDRNADELRVFSGRELIATADIKNFSKKYYWSK